MPSLTVGLADRSPAFMTQLRYALAFLSQDLKSYALDETTGTITCEFAPAADLDEMQRRISRLVGRYQQNKSGAKSITYFDLRRPLAAVDAWAGLLGNRKAANLIQAILDEEKAANERLNELARTRSNDEALCESKAKGTEKVASKRPENPMPGLRPVSAGRSRIVAATS